MSFSISSTNTENFSCINHTFSNAEQKKLDLISEKIDSFMYSERKDMLAIAHKIQEKVYQTPINAQKKCLIERALSDFEKNTRETLSSYWKIWEYILHPYYRDSYLPKIPEDTLKSYIFKKDNSRKEIFLTFDDGPYNTNIIKYLKQEEIAGTFFLMCSRINSKNIKRYKDPLFSLWGHTMYHDNYDELSKSDVIADIDGCSDVFHTHWIPHRIYRPAYGIINAAETEGLIKNKLTAYVWSIDSADWAWDFTQQKAQEIINHTKSGDILLFHEWVDLEVFDFLIDWLRKKQYSFGKL